MREREREKGEAEEERQANFTLSVEPEAGLNPTPGHHDLSEIK